MLQEQAFQLPHRGLQAVLNVGLPSRTAVPVRIVPLGLLAVVGAQPLLGHQSEMGLQLLLHQALAAAPELL